MVGAELKSGKADDVTEYPSPDDIVVHKDALTKARFEFDQVFKPTGSQEEVFENVKPFVTSFLDGFNVCIFAYGQTGSGKVRVSRACVGRWRIRLATTCIRKM